MDCKFYYSVEVGKRIPKVGAKCIFDGIPTEWNVDKIPPDVLEVLNE